MFFFECSLFSKENIERMNITLLTSISQTRHSLYFIRTADKKTKNFSTIRYTIFNCSTYELRILRINLVEKDGKYMTAFHYGCYQEGNTTY
jgi:hypothetical protein